METALRDRRLIDPERLARCSLESVTIRVNADDPPAIACLFGLPFVVQTRCADRLVRTRTGPRDHGLSSGSSQQAGCLGSAEVAVLEERGVGMKELLEIVAIIAAFTLATFANNLANTRIDPEYR